MNQTIAARAPQARTRQKWHGLAIFTIILAALALCLPSAPHVAWADDATTSIDCELSDADREAYAADGTLDARIAYMQSLQTDSTDPGLIAQAQARESGAVAAYSNSNTPSYWKTGMPTTGNARVLAVCVQFPDGVNVFADANAEAASLEAMFNGTAGASIVGFPYDSLHGYYYRSSYGALNITCPAVLTYTAEHPRDHYTSNVNTLFYEVAKAIDDNPDTYGVDLSNFDGNGDGVLDGLYVLFAGQDTGWGSAWWPSMRHYSNNDDTAQATFGHGSQKVKLDASVLLAKTRTVDSSDRQPVCTLIHETGHVLGLPDYYHYSSAGASSANGLGVFDMMNSSQGDHNAFSKWLLGWIDDSDITRVCVSEDGVRAVRGSQSFEASGTLEQTLEAFDNSDVSKTGGFIAISNSDSIFNTLFTSFYLLQYDQYAGNQSLTVTTDEGEMIMRSGLRAFRVQAAVNQDGTNFVKSNSNATSQHDQLIESLDPSDDGVTPIAFGNFFDEGRVISPSSAPSTNFEESIDFGYTGIQIAVGTSEASQGTVGISYAEKPAESAFELTPVEGFQLTEAGTFSLSMNRTAYIASRAEPYPIIDEPKLVVDGTAYDVGYTQIIGSEYTFNLSLEPGTLRADSTCQLVFPAGYFIIGKQGGQSIPSDPLAVDLPIAPLAEIEASGVYENMDVPANATVALSNAFESNGSTKFLRSASWFDEAEASQNNSLSMCAFAADGTTCSNKPIDISGVSFGNGFMWGSAKIDVTPLGNGILFARVASTNSSSLAGAYLWIDEATNSVVAQQTLTYESPQSVVLNVDGSATIASPMILASGATSWTLTRKSLDTQTGAVTESYALVQGDGSWITECIFNAGDGYIAISNKGLTGGTHVRLYSAHDMASLFDTPAQGALDPTAFLQLTPATQASLTATSDDQGKETAAPLWPSDARVRNGKLYVSYVQPMLDKNGGAAYPKPRVVCFNMDGTPAWDSIFPDSQFIASNAMFKLSFSSQGAIALASINTSSTTGTTNEIIFIGKNGEQLSRNVNKADFGTWLGPRWIALSANACQVGSDWLNRTVWYLSKQIGVVAPDPGTDPTDPSDPTGPTEPTDPSNPTNPNGQAGSKAPASDANGQGLQSSGGATNQANFAETGDATWNAALAAAGLAFVSCGIALIAYAARKRARRNE